MAVEVNPENLADLLRVYEALKPLAKPDALAECYIDGSLGVRHGDGYLVGRFVAQDDFWVLVVGEER